MVKKPHILLIHQVFVTPFEGGGTRHFELATALVRDGYDVTVIASDLNYTSGKKKAKHAEYLNGVRIIDTYTLPTVHSGKIGRILSFIFFSILSFINAIRVKNVDLVWGTYPPLFQSITAYFVSLLKGVPLAFEIRDLWIKGLVDLGALKNKKLIAILQKIETYLIRTSKIVIINSPGFESCVKAARPDKPFALIPNGVTVEDFIVKEGNGPSLRKELNLQDKFLAIYLGNLGVANDLDTVLDAAKLMVQDDRVLFLLMGGGIRRKHLEHRIYSEGLSNVLLLGTRPKGEIPYILKDIDVCLGTLKNLKVFETVYPNKIFDYMAASKPIILAMGGEIRKVISAADCGELVEPGDSEGIAGAIRRYLENPALIQKQGQRGHEYVSKYFERNVIAKNLENAIRSSLGSR